MKRLLDSDRRNPAGTEICIIGFRIEAETAKKLDKICEREGITKSTMVRRLVRKFVENN